MSCPHGLVGSCPDCPPEFYEITGDPNAPPTGVWAAIVCPKRAEGIWVEVRRQKPSGALDWATWHFTRWGARRAARLYEQTGRVKGFRP